MPQGVTSAQLEALRLRAERALGAGDTERQHEALEELLASAPEAGDDAIFAHRHLGESLLETDPWRAALHLRHVVRAEPRDDVGHALLGLSHALLGNYRASVGCFRRALSLAPKNAFYEHNLGHILDLGLDRPSAEPHLRGGRESSPEHHEIIASHAHCLARLGRFDEARGAISQAIALRPNHPGHRALSRWIASGAPPSSDPTGSDTPSAERVTSDSADPVERAIAWGMTLAEASPRDIARAQSLWTAFRAQGPARVRKPEVLAAAVDYALACVVDGHRIERLRFAEHYGVSTSALSARVRQLVSSLGLVESDPRFSA
ncbi:MAG: tetratricopeptide repeat protein [Deltaproteobacteria bacterium]|nr:tetratricopeptide repeat protein [Deltaproteobacteria bacterium]